MPSLVVPQIELDRLIQLILDHYKFQYGITVTADTITASFIQPRVGWITGFEIVSNSDSDNFSCRFYINYTSDYKSNLDPFQIEEIINTSYTSGLANNRYVCYAVLPRTQFPTLSKYVFVPVDDGGGGSPSTYTVGFLQTTGSVVSGQSLDINIGIDSAPSAIVTAHYASANGTAVASVDYVALDGTTTWDVNDGVQKTITLYTGEPYYYHWVAGYDTSQFTLVDSADGLIYNATNNDTQNTYYPSIRTFNLALPSVDQNYYHEFLFGPNGFQQHITIEIDINTVDGSGNTSSSFYAAYLQYNTGTNVFDAQIYSTFNGQNLTPPNPITMPVTIGFEINHDSAIKFFINDTWYNVDDFSFNSDASQIAFSDMSYLSGLTITSVNLLITFDLTTNGGGSNIFDMTAKVSPNQIHVPSDAISPPAGYIGTSGGTLSLTLSNPSSNATIGTTTDNITILDANVCYQKLIVNDDETGFDNSTGSIITGYGGIHYLYTNVNWSNTTSSCGVIADLRLTATNDPTQLGVTDFSQTPLTAAGITNFPVFPNIMIDDVREVTTFSWPNGKFPVSGNFSFNTTDNDLPYNLTLNSDGSYEVKFRFRSFPISGQSNLMYKLMDYNNTDTKGSLPKLNKPSLLIQSYDGTSAYILIYSNDVLYDHTGSVINQGYTFTYTLDGSDPNSGGSTISSGSQFQTAATPGTIVKFKASATGFTDSDVSTCTLNYFTRDLTFPYLTNSISGNTNNIFYFNADGPFTGYESILITLTDQNSSPGSDTMVYSFDGETWHDYTAPFSFPVGWKTPIGKAGFPSVFYYTKQANTHTSSIANLNIFIEYPSRNLTFVPNQNDTSVSVANKTVTLVNTIHNNTELVPVAYFQTHATCTDDFRYIEMKCTNLVDQDGILQIHFNSVGFGQDGHVYPTNYSPVSVPALAWTVGDTLCFWYNYLNGSFQVRVNNGAWQNTSQELFYTTYSEFNMGIQYFESNGHSLNGSAFQLHSLASEFEFAIPSNTLPTETLTP